ncbi:hypothetical protein K0M31_013466, partial [Melipona bicolor]
LEQTRLTTKRRDLKSENFCRAEVADWRSASPCPHFPDRWRYPLHCIDAPHSLMHDAVEGIALAIRK